MSTSYYIYTEARLGNEWVLINGKVPDYEWDWNKEEYTGEYKYKTALTYYSGSRSYFSETYNKLRDIGRSVKFSQLSSELQKDWEGSVEKENVGADLYYNPIVVDYNDFCKLANPKVFTHHGIIHKDNIVGFETGDIEELWQDTETDFSKMSDIEKQAYQYYEWDNPYDWLLYFKEIAKMVNCQYEQFRDMNYLGKKLPLRLVIISE